MVEYIFSTDLVVKVLILAIINMIIGMIWYSKFAFGKMWMKAIGKSEKDFQNMGKGAGKMYLMSFFGSIIIFFILGEILLLIPMMTIIHAIILSFLIWFGFLILVGLPNVMFEEKSMTSFMIYGIYQLVVFIIAAIIFAGPVLIN